MMRKDYSGYTEKIILLHSQGVSNRGIQKILGMSNGSVASRLKKLNLKPNGTKSQSLKYIDVDTCECSKCNRILPSENFFWQRVGKANPYQLSYCKECKKKQARAWRYVSKERYLRDIYFKTKRRAKNKNIQFNITPEYLLELAEQQGDKCFYTDIELCHTPDKTRNNYSIDKIIPSKGYVEGNVVWCTHRANTIKNDMTLDEMEKWTPDWYNRIENFRRKYEE